MKKSDLIFLSISFFVWRITILAIAFLSTKFIPLYSRDFLGGSFSTYQTNPIFWGHLNFDGEHYLALAQFGYQPLTYFFFPLFSFLVSIMTGLKSIDNLAITGLIISNLSMFILLIGIYKLVKLDFEESIAKLTVILLLVFPTSFFFGSFYTESIFLCLVVWSFYFARNQNFLLASLLAALASAARVIGIALLPVLVVEWLSSKNKDSSNLLEVIFISPLGLLIYLFYLVRKTGDALIFLHQITIYGGQRSSNLVLLPQVLYRYAIKIIPNIPLNFFPAAFTILLEFSISIIFIGIIIYTILKLRLSYSLYATLSFLIPTLTGSFSSMPRYVLVIFPSFIAIALVINKFPKIYKYLLFFGMLILSGLSIALFWRGYWIS